MLPFVFYDLDRVLRGMFSLKRVEIQYGGKYIKRSFIICRPHTLHQISLG
jgi:hypothetical protein